MALQEAFLVHIILVALLDVVLADLLTNLETSILLDILLREAEI